jgi:hypothetical protein
VEPASTPNRRRPLAPRWWVQLVLHRCWFRTARSGTAGYMRLLQEDELVQRTNESKPHVNENSSNDNNTNNNDDNSK